jgi:hypothetical protein
MKVPEIGTVNMSTLPILLDGGLARTNLFEVSITPSWLSPSNTTSFLQFLKNGTQYGSIDFTLDFGNKLGLLCSEASLPTSSYATAEVKDNYMGVAQEFAHTRINTDIDFTFYIDRQYKVLGFFEAWMDFISGAAGGIVPQIQGDNSPTPGYYRRYNYPKYYKTDGFFIKKFERDFASSQATNISFQLVNAFPKSVTSIPVAYGEAEIMKVTVTMNYDRYIMRREFAPLVVEENAANDPIANLLSGVEQYTQQYKPYGPYGPTYQLDPYGNLVP